MTGSKGLALMEAIIALAGLGIVFAVLFTSFRSSHEHAVQTRNRAGAVVLAESFLDELRAHDYGKPAPGHWPGNSKPANDWETRTEPRSFRDFAVAADGRSQKMKYHLRVSYANGSFVDGTKNQNWDEVTLTITWNEAVGDSQDGTRMTRKVLSTSMLVRRAYAR